MPAVLSARQFNGLIRNLSFHPGKRKKLFQSLPEKMQARALLCLSKRVQRSIINSLETPELLGVLEHLDPDEATDMIQLLPRRKQPYIIEKLSHKLRESVEILSQFDPKTAAGLMSLDYIQVDVDDTITSVAKQFKVHEKRTGRFPAILIMENGKVIGTLSGHELGIARPSDKVKKHIKKILTIKQSASHEEVLHFFKSHPHNKMAVLGKKENVIGIIYSDDILRLLQQETAAALYDFAGVHDEETIADTAAQKIKSRYKWLIINLGTGFLAAFTVGLFNEIIAKYVLLAVYMPIIAGMGGNAGTQTLAVLVRGIALKQIEIKTAWPTLKREIVAGFSNGIINGILVGVIVILLSGDMKIALVLSMAMVINLIVAAFFGTLVPLIMAKLNKDPAASATVFITTATDVLGFMTFLGLATLMLV